MSYQQEQVREWTWVFGAEHPDREWINSPFDSWEKNPHYTGPKGRHPEDDADDDLVDELLELHRQQFGPRTIDTDDIPF